LACPPASGSVGIRGLGALKLLYFKPPPFKFGSQTLMVKSLDFFSRSTAGPILVNSSGWTPTELAENWQIDLTAYLGGGEARRLAPRVVLRGPCPRRPAAPPVPHRPESVLPDPRPHPGAPSPRGGVCRGGGHSVAVWSLLKGEGPPPPGGGHQPRGGGKSGFRPPHKGPVPLFSPCRNISPPRTPKTSLQIEVSTKNGN